MDLKAVNSHQMPTDNEHWWYRLKNRKYRRNYWYRTIATWYRRYF